MDSLSSFGKVVRSYEGEGTVTLRTGNAYSCSFSAVQVTTGGIFYQLTLTTSADQYGQARREFEDLGSEILSRIEGVTEDGFNVVSDRCEASLHVTGLRIGMVGEEWEPLKVSVVTTSLTATNQTVEQVPVILRFAFVNFEYCGNELEREENEQGVVGRRSLLRINLPHAQVVFRQVDRYREIVEAIKAQNGIDVTCELECSLKDGLSLEDALGVADDMYLLLSIARGRFVNWIYYAGLDAAGSTVFVKHQERNVSPRRSVGVIDVSNPKNTVSFLQAAYSSLQELKCELATGSYPRSATEFANTYVAARTAQFAEAGGLTAVALLDSLRAHWLEKHDKLYLVSDRVFQKRKEGLRSKVRDVLRAAFSDCLGTDPEQLLKFMSSHVAGFNWRPMVPSYLEFFASSWVGIPQEEKDVRRFNDIRNSLAHRARFCASGSDERIREYEELIHLLDRVALGLLGYEGHYVNYVSCNREEFTRQPMGLCSRHGATSR